MISLIQIVNVQLLSYPKFVTLSFWKVDSQKKRLRKRNSFHLVIEAKTTVGGKGRATKAAKTEANWTTKCVVPIESDEKANNNIRL